MHQVHSLDNLFYAFRTCCGLLKRCMLGFLTLSSPADMEASDEHVLLGFYSSRALRRLVLTCRNRDKATVVPEKLWAAAFQGRCKRWLGTPAEKARRFRCDISATCSWEYEA